MAKIATLFADVLSQAQDCPKVVAVNEIRKAAIDLCESSAVWTRTHDPIYTYKNGAEYDMDDTPQDAVADRLLDAKLDGLPFKAGTPRDLFQYEGQVSRPLVVAVVSPKIVSLAPTPDGKYVLSMRVAYKPSPKADEIDDSVLDQWRDTIVNGALYRLKMMVNKPWSDPKAAAVHKSFYDEGVRKAKLKAVTGYGATTNTVRPRSFG